MAEPKKIERKTSTLMPLNWRKIRLGLKRSVPIPAPIFFLIFLGTSWACFTLYFKIERTNSLIESLERRTAAIESHLDGLEPGAPEMSEEEQETFEAPPPQAIEM